jgi:hypothetical protein
MRFLNIRTPHLVHTDSERIAMIFPARRKEIGSSEPTTTVLSGPRKGKGPGAARKITDM